MGTTPPIMSDQPNPLSGMIEGFSLPIIKLIQIYLPFPIDSLSVSFRLTST